MAALRWAARATALVCGLSPCVACVAQVTAPSVGRAEPIEPVESAKVVRCDPVDSDPLAIIEGAPCPVVLLVAEGDATERMRLVLRDMTSPARDVAAGVAPEACFDLSLCDFSGASTRLGPLVVVERRGHASEIPEDVWLGFIGEPAESGVAPLGFFSLWAGPSAIVDGTHLGPTYALSPYACGGGIFLRLEARLNPALTEVPADTLRAREGRYDIVEGQIVRTQVESEGTCLPLEIELP